MPSPKRLLIFALGVTTIIALMLLPWSGLDRIYSAGFRDVANVLFGSIGVDGTVRFERDPQAVAGMDTLSILANRGSGAQAHAPYSVRMTGYVPTVLVIALCLATPKRWTRRLAVLGIATLLVQVFVALRVYLRLVEVFSAGDTLAVYELGPVGGVAIRTFSQVLSVSIFGSFVAPILIWAAVALCPADWQTSARNSRN